MKIYAKRNGVYVEADVPDGAVYIGIGSTDDGTGNLHRRRQRLAPIVAIDWEARTFQRHALGQHEPFPERWYREEDIDWKPCAEQSA